MKFQYKTTFMLVLRKKMLKKRSEKNACAAFGQLEYESWGQEPSEAVSCGDPDSFKGRKLKLKALSVPQKPREVLSHGHHTETDIAVTLGDHSLSQVKQRLTTCPCHTSFTGMED